MSWRRIVTIYLKDMRDAVRDARVLVALLVPLGIGLFYNATFSDEEVQVEATVAYASPDQTELPAQIAAVLGDSIDLAFEQLDTAAAVEAVLSEDDADLGLVLPAGFDDAVRRGETPPLTIVEPPETTVGGDYVAAALDPAVRRLAGQPPPAAVTVQTTTAPEGSVSVVDELGVRTWSLMASIVLMIGMISMLAIPIILAEEAEKKTLDALVLIASYLDVIAAKALLGLSSVAVMVALLLGITSTTPEDWPLFAAAVALLALALIGLGLLMAGFFKNANQLNTWASFLLIPVVAPAFIVGLPTPDLLQTVAAALPTGAAAKLLFNSAATEPIFANQLLSIVVVAAWAVLAFGLLLWQLSRRQA